MLAPMDRLDTAKVFSSQQYTLKPFFYTLSMSLTDRKSLKQGCNVVGRRSGSVGADLLEQVCWSRSDPRYFPRPRLWPRVNVSARSLLGYYHAMVRLAVSLSSL